MGQPLITRALIAMAFIVWGGHASAAVIYADPAAFITGTVVTTQFSHVSFAAVPVTGEIVGTTVITPFVQSGPQSGNVSIVGGAFVPPGGIWSSSVAMRVDFVIPVNFASALFLPDDTDTGFLQVFSVNGLLLDEQIVRSSADFELSFTATDRLVGHILIGYADTGFIGRVGYDPVSRVPEPGTLALALLSLVGVGVTRRRAAGLPGRLCGRLASKPMSKSLSA